jgi:hypothetical protein
MCLEAFQSCRSGLGRYACQICNTAVRVEVLSVATSVESAIGKFQPLLQTHSGNLKYCKIQGLRVRPGSYDERGRIIPTPSTDPLWEAQVL